MRVLSVFELRNYATQEGRRDDLIEMFEREFLDLQEGMGSRVVGVFRDLDDRDRFVWIRAFVDMETRLAALTAFYTHPHWLERRDAANATMIDSDNVLLLRPVSGDCANSAQGAGTGFFALETYFLAPRGDEDFAAFFKSNAEPELSALGCNPFATFATEHSKNTYPRLPVRENETVFVTLTRFASPEAYASFLATLRVSARWGERVAPEIARRIVAPNETMRLQPTARSALR